MDFMTCAGQALIRQKATGRFGGYLLGVCLLLGALLLHPAAGKAGEMFPVYPAMKPNVDFWEAVYSRYTTTQGVLHDEDDLSIVYAVVNLVDWDAPGAAGINTKRIKSIRQHYKKMLADLASGKKPSTSEEERVARMFPPNSLHALDKARNTIRLQIGQKDRFLEGIIRSGAYMPSIKRILSAYQLPQELAYLPHVESSFNPDAYSKAGAAGLWQFTRSTGRQYMEVDDVVDQRRDAYSSTRAAAIFLKENYQELGSWPLAITAYNHGRNGVARALKKYGDYERIFTSHKSKLFQFASRNFYSEFIAAMNVAKRLENDPGIIQDRPEATILVKMDGYVLFEDVRAYFQVSTEDLTHLNPALLAPVVSGKKYIPKDYYVRLPANERTRDLAAGFPSRLYHPRQVSDEEYIVRRGDTAGAIAGRYQISLNELIAANGLDKRAMIRVGQKLKIPGKGGQQKEGKGRKANL